MRVLLLIGLVVSLSNAALGQDLPIAFQRYSSKDGLSSNTVYSICRDSYGFLWIGTSDGLNRYDGRNYSLYRYDADDTQGLRANHITALCEDTQGRIWIGTNGGGLSYYDRQMDVIRPYEKTPDDKWLSNAITSIEKDSRGNIWVGSYGGICVINASNLDEVPGLAYAEVVETFMGKLSRFIFRDSWGHMWVSSAADIYQVSEDLKSIRKYAVLPPAAETVNRIAISCVTEDKYGRIWAGSMLGLKYLDPRQTEFKTFEGGRFKGHVSKNYVHALAKDAKGGIWVGTENGLDIINAADLSVQNFKPDAENVHSLSHKSIRAICVDQYGIYWVGTFQGGLNKYDTNLSQFSLKEIGGSEKRGGNTGMVTSFFEYRNKVLLGVDGGGVYSYNKASDLLTPLPVGVNEASELTVLALEGHQDKLWIGTYQNGVLYYDLKSGLVSRYIAGDGENDLNHNDIFCLKRDHAGNIWIGTNGGGVNVIQARDGKVKKYLPREKSGQGLEPAGHYIRALEEDQEGNIWIGAYGAGLSVYNPKSQSTTFLNKSSASLPSNYVSVLHIDKKGNVWVGTNGSGIGVLTKGADQFTTLSEKDGLINGVVQSIVEDNNGKIWFSTNKGLSCYDPIKKNFKNYTHSAGLQEGAFMRGAGLKLADGELYFGGQNGFNHFYPKNLKTNRNPANVVLTELKIDNNIVLPSEKGSIRRSLLTTDRIDLKFKQNFSISFAALNLTVPEDNQIEYRLLGFDKEWIRSGQEQSAYYTNLDPGEYTFQVRASNNDGIWNDEIKSIAIVVAPPFWRTVYAYIIYVSLFVGGLLWIRANGIRKLKQKFALEQERIQVRQLIEQQQREAEAMHRLDQMKIKFLTNLSHEFRTPISLIVGPIDDLIRQSQDKATSGQLSLIKRNARRLLNLVNQLLDFRKMEEHELKLNNTVGNLVAFVEEVSLSFNDIAIQKGIDYSFNACREHLYCVYDEDKIERVLFNLISNAFKFTKKGGDIAVLIVSAEQEDDKVHVFIEVRDTGIGIPKESQSAIFETFFQHDTEGKVLNQGSGIGLSIASSFVHMYGGHIQVDSEPGKGSIFTFDLWLDTAEAPAAETCSQEESRPLPPPLVEARQKPVILIVEDDDDFRYYLQECLKNDYQVVESVNGKEGWQKALFHHPDMVISDVQMPVMNGMELAQKLAQDKRTKHIPIILLTASRVENGLVFGLESGAVDYITKPFDINVLLAKINSLLILNQAFREVYSKQISVIAPEVEVMSEQEKFLQNVLAYIYNNMDNPQLSVEALSEHLCVSRATLYNRLLEFSGMSPVDFIRSVRLERAAALLEKSDRSISEIAYETGFANPNYFAKVFKAKYRMTPSEYIRSLKQVKVK